MSICRTNELKLSKMHRAYFKVVHNGWCLAFVPPCTYFQSWHAVSWRHNAKHLLPAVFIQNYDYKGRNRKTGTKKRDGSLSAKNIFVVESEKTAIICEICKKNNNSIFIASGGLQNLIFLLRCKIEKDRNLFLIPDESAEQIWSAKIEKLGISGTLKPIEKKPELGTGYDIADLLILKNKKQC